jgi:hypothetical protein
MRRRIPTLFLFCLVLGQLVPTAGVAAAQTGDLTLGVRVRVRSPKFDQAIDGVVIEKSTDSVVVSTPTGVHHRFAVDSLQSFEFFRGHTRSAGAKTGALWGLGIGTALSVVSFGFAGDANSVSSTRAEVALIVWAVSGYGILGALIGTAVGGDEWNAVRLKPTVEYHGSADASTPQNGWHSTASARAKVGLRIPVAF